MIKPWMMVPTNILPVASTAIHAIVVSQPEPKSALIGSIETLHGKEWSEDLGGMIWIYLLCSLRNVCNLLGPTSKPKSTDLRRWVLWTEVSQTFEQPPGVGKSYIDAISAMTVYTDNEQSHAMMNPYVRPAGPPLS